MTQVKLWQIVSQTVNGIVFSDANGNLVTLPQGAPGQVLVINAQGVPEWVANTALSTALEAKTDAANAIATASAYTDAQIAALVDNAPVALNTLNELAQKLNGEDSAINALLLQVDGKAEKTEVATQVAQAKQDAILDSKQYTDDTVAAASAATLQQANEYTDQRVAAAVTTAATDATNKAEAAKDSAIVAANTHTDNAVATQAQVSAADATQKAAQAKTDAVSESNTYTDGKLTAFPQRLRAKTIATACYVISTAGVNPEGGIPLSSFAEVTGANLQPGAMLTPKLLFVNGLAMSSDWTPLAGTIDIAKVSFAGRLLQHAFDGSDNAVMVLCEYTNNAEIYALPEPVYNPPQMGGIGFGG